MDNEIDLRSAGGQLNILVSNQAGGCNAVYLRYSYVPHQQQLDENGRDEDGRLCSVVVPGSEVFEPGAVNNAGRLGAYCHRPDWPAIYAAVAAIRADWGDVPVQVNEARYRPDAP